MRNCVFAADVERRCDRSATSPKASRCRRTVSSAISASPTPSMRVAVPVKYSRDEIGLEPDRVEDLRAAIGLIGRDAHLGHHLEDALVDRLDVALEDLLLVELLREIVLHREQRLEGEIGIDRLGAVAGEAAEVMHLARLAGFDDEADRRAQALADEVMMHRRAGEQRRHRNVLGAGAPIRQDDDVDAFAHRGLGARAQGFERVLEPRGALLGRPGGVEDARAEMAAADLGHRADLFQVRIGEDRLAHFQPLEMRRRLRGRTGWAAAR